MKLAVVGTGIAGLTVARELASEHELTVFEAEDWIGGHTHTVDVPAASTPGEIAQPGSETVAVDTGFIVFNRKTYPNFCARLEELGVPSQASDMSFSVRCEASGLEYNGTSLNGLLAQRTNALRPRFWRMVRDILRFYREAPSVLEDPEAGELTLGEFLERGRYSPMFIDKHLIPMGAAVWSSRPGTMLAFPMRFLVQFFHNHGFLQVDDRPEWLVVQGGSREYVRKLVAPFGDRIRLSTPVVGLRRCEDGVRLQTAGGEEATFDRVVLATHADTSLRMLSDATGPERELLGAFGFQRNEVVLHTDETLMPRRRRAWASWNYHVGTGAGENPQVTYWMNNLQSLPGPTQYLLTLNRSSDIDPDSVLREFVYDHPIFTTGAVQAQARHAEIDGANGVHFCGAYWSYGFHEDGVRSGLEVARRIRQEVYA